MTPYQRMHFERGRKLRKLSWTLEGFVILTALGLAFTLLIGDANEAEAQSALIVATLPLIAAAAIELAKIPLAEAIIFARWYLKPVALVLLIGVAFSTFETLFQGFEHGANLRIAKVTEAQTDLIALEGKLRSLEAQRQHRGDQTTRELDHIQKQIAGLRDQNVNFRADMEDIVSGANDPNALALIRARDVASDELEAIKQERNAFVEDSAAAWQSESDQYQARIATGGKDGEYAARLQRAMPAKSTVMERAVEEWTRSNSGRLQRVTEELDQINSQLKEYLQSSGVVDQQRLNDLSKLIDQNNQKISELTDQSKSLTFLEVNDEPENISELEEEILRATSSVSLLAASSNIYRFASVLFGKPEADVSTAEARKAAAIFWGTLAGVLALGTSGLALLGAHHTSLSLSKRSAKERKLLKRLQAAALRNKQAQQLSPIAPAIEIISFKDGEESLEVQEQNSHNGKMEGLKNVA